MKDVVSEKCLDFRYIFKAGTTKLSERLIRNGPRKRIIRNASSSLGLNNWKNSGVLYMMEKGQAKELVLLHLRWLIRQLSEDIK